MGCLWCGKYSRQCKTMPSGPPEFIPPFIPVTGMKCSYGKISSPLTEISGTEPARPLIWIHPKFNKGFRGEARSRKPGQPSQPGSYEEALNMGKLVNREKLMWSVYYSSFLASSTSSFNILCKIGKMLKELHFIWLIINKLYIFLWFRSEKYFISSLLFTPRPFSGTFCGNLPSFLDFLAAVVYLLEGW